MHGAQKYIILITRVRVEYGELFHEWRVKIQPTSEMTHHIPRMKSVIYDLFYI